MTPKSFLFLISLISLLNFSQAIELNSNATLNTSSSNSSIIFDANISATNISIQSTYILLQEINLTNNSGTYACDDINFSTENSNLNSSNFNCTFLSPPITPETPQTSTTTSSTSGGGTTNMAYYFSEENKDIEDNTLLVSIRMKEGSKEELEIENPKNTSVKKITIASKEHLFGEIEIASLNLLPINCGFNQGNKAVYKVIKLNNTIEEQCLENVEMLLEIDKSWINENNISKIDTIKCTPEYDDLEMNLVETTPNSSIYKVSCKGFSTWVIFGEKTQASQEQDTPKRTITGKAILGEISEQKKIYFYLVTLLLIILAFFIIKKNPTKIYPIPKTT